MTPFLVHLAIAVDSVDAAATIYAALGFELGPAEVVAHEFVKLRKAVREGLCLELIEPFPSGSGSVAKFLAKRGPGLHHVALASEDLEKDLQALKLHGISPLRKPGGGADSSRVVFLDPSTTGGVLIELVERNSASAGMVHACGA